MPRACSIFKCSEHTSMKWGIQVHFFFLPGTFFLPKGLWSWWHRRTSLLLRRQMCRMHGVREQARCLVLELLGYRGGLRNIYVLEHCLSLDWCWQDQQDSIMMFWGFALRNLKSGWGAINRCPHNKVATYCSLGKSIFELRLLNES